MLAAKHDRPLTMNLRTMSFFSRITGLAAVALLAACSSQPTSMAEKTTPGPLPRQPSPVAAAPQAAPACARIAAVGDIMLGGSAAAYMQDGFDYAFAATKSYLQNADITIGNLETALTEQDNDWVDKQYRFRNPPALAHALAKAGFDLVSLANNHSMDFGPDGLADTLSALDKAGVKVHGAGFSMAEARKPVLVTLANGLTIAFLAYSNTFPEQFWATEEAPGTAFGRKEHVIEDVTKAKAQADRVVVSFHWGREKMQELRGYQPLLAHAAIDAGASLVLGHHPHILQGIERYNDGLVLYSLGNFAFGSFSRAATTSALAQITLCDNKQAADFQLQPLNVSNHEVFFQPKVVTGEAVLEELQAMSGPLGVALQLKGGVIVEAEKAPDPAGE